MDFARIAAGSLTKLSALRERLANTVVHGEASGVRVSMTATMQVRAVVLPPALLRGPPAAAEAAVLAAVNDARSKAMAEGAKLPTELLGGNASAAAGALAGLSGLFGGKQLK